METIGEFIWKEKIANPNVTAEELSDRLGIPVMDVHSVLNKSGSAEPERIRLLKRGIELTSGDRNKTYGPPWDNLDACAQLISAYITAKFGVSETFRLTAEDVAHFMQLVKMTRTFHGSYHDDNYLDNAVYGAIAGECRKYEEQG